MDRKIIWLTVFTIVLSVLAVAFLWKYTWALFGVLLVITIYNFIVSKSMAEMKMFIFGAIIGPIFEMFVISFGAWAYPAPNLYNIPVWLILLWGLATLVLIRAKDYFPN